MISQPIGPRFDYSMPAVNLGDWQQSDYEKHYKYWNYDKEKQLQYVKDEIDKQKYELAKVIDQLKNNDGKIYELQKKIDYAKKELYYYNNELNKASDQKTSAEARRYTVKEKMRDAHGNELHSLAREKERLDTEIYKLHDQITSAQWKINDNNYNLNSATQEKESLQNANYYLKDQASNLTYKLKDLASERDRLEREKFA